MLQWVQTSVEVENEQGEKKWEYKYEKVWLPYVVDSKFFNDRTKQNPINFWPFKSKQITAQNIQLGKYNLNQSQIARLGSKDEKYQWFDEGKKTIKKTEDIMSRSGFSPFVLRGDYLMSSTATNGYSEDHVGQFRVKFHYNKCGSATVIA